MSRPLPAPERSAHPAALLSGTKTHRVKSSILLGAVSLDHIRHPRKEHRWFTEGIEKMNVEHQTLTKGGVRMVKVFIAPRRYIQGVGVLKEIGKYVAPLGKRVLVAWEPVVSEQFNAIVKKRI
jgi:hypothetical protein